MYFETMQSLKKFSLQQGEIFFERRILAHCRQEPQAAAPYAGRVFVVSSQKGFGHPRRYTIHMISNAGEIQTIGQFQQFGSKIEAHNFARHFAMCMKNVGQEMTS
tara:strand:- start:1785 stop:2099 length:315 start_codon:yes stop_codon:yes gene_type:complete